MVDISDFTLDTAAREKITAGLSKGQKSMVNHWIDLQETINKGDWDGMDTFFHPKMTYANPSRPDLGSYASWKTSPQALFRVFPPCLYRTTKVWGRGRTEIAVLCHHYGKQTGGRYMGVEPQGQEINVWWFSWIKFKDNKIIHIYSIADVLGMFIDVGVIEKSKLPTDPYK